MEEIIDHFCHEHPLILTQNVGNKEVNLYCYGCQNPVISESDAYICVSRCGSKSMILHKKCGELPAQILHPSHRYHYLHLFDYEYLVGSCSLCFKNLHHCIGYRCLICNLDMHISCQQLIPGLFEEKTIQHPSHRRHVLTLIRKPASLFNCDGCGNQDWGHAYACTTCDFFIHEACASLPSILPTNHHHHSLALAFNFPFKHRRFMYKCEICGKDFHTVYWVYYCGDCRFFAHIKCATSPLSEKPESSSLKTTAQTGSGMIQLPVDDISKELIARFIIREKGEIPDVDAMPSLITPANEFNYHNHPLSLVREFESQSEPNEVKICDVCVSPIYANSPYYNCTTCNTYFLHSTCYFLPKTLSRRLATYGLYSACIPTRKNHIFAFYTSSALKLDLKCNVCGLHTNGMVYKCECGVCIDVKCASLPYLLRHSFHPHHKWLQKKRTPPSRKIRCSAKGCIALLDREAAYLCATSDCDFALHLLCALLPRSVRDKRWDKKHSLVLTCNASLDHPTDFYCESCETEIHPKDWMYHCRPCDSSFHPRCLTASGVYRNIKFGRRIEADDRLHPHPLTFNIVTLKLRCDICRRDCFNTPGLECELCNYAACQPCAVEVIG